MIDEEEEGHDDDKNIDWHLTVTFFERGDRPTAKFTRRAVFPKYECESFKRPVWVKASGIISLGFRLRYSAL